MSLHLRAWCGRHRLKDHAHEMFTFDDAVATLGQPGPDPHTSLMTDETWCGEVSPRP